MNFSDTRIEKLEKKTNNYLYYGVVIFGILGVVFFGWAFYIQKNLTGTKNTLHELIYNESTKEGKKVKLTVTSIPYVFAEETSKKTNAKYYFLMDGDYLYVGYLNDDTYEKLNQKDISKNPITIYGKTKKIPSDVIDIAIKVYNEGLEEPILTRDNYSEYIGEICIDTDSVSLAGAFQTILGILFNWVGFIYLILFLVKKRRINKFKKDTVLWEDIISELNDKEVEEYFKFGTCLTKKYIVDSMKGLTIIPYQDIVWLYLHESRYNGVTNDRYLIAVTKEKKNVKVARLSGFHPKSKDTYMEIIQKIYEKNPNMLVGYTSENRKAAKNLYQKYKGRNYGKKRYYKKKKRRSYQGSQNRRGYK